ncbi:MAG: bifunctional demethylmenaquinone methyltransferase/2-methoxy-6-polyprenyl-1,4-benzoquinol methylase UbiE [Phycisphaeraceae bacterium]|nr:bifunctional demethylmenaquinone methyltransferase/2-methoxy-6-polyprenyl-1,4-benzoquinol methylase UbiE [Phycisphaeraceae bacterium]
MTDETASPAWDESDLGRPHDLADKASRVRRMFTAIAPSYDLNNRIHSLGRDQAWRRAAVKAAEVRPDDRVLDVACGTGDLSIAFARAGADTVVGVDFTYDMLSIARRKSAEATGRLVFHGGDAMRLPVADGTFDIVSIAFGIRNVTDPSAALAEFYRVLKPGGRVVVLEFDLPRNAVLRGMYQIYFQQVLPRTASWIARDRSGAYRYLPRSVDQFIRRDDLVSMIERTGFASVTARSLTLGIAVIYLGSRA